MIRSLVLRCAVVLMTACAFAVSCKKDDDADNTQPTITGFDPTSDTAGSTVVISGTHFNPTASQNSVYFNDIAAVVTEATATTLTVTVPIDATSGPIRVTTGGTTVTSADNFTVINTAFTFSPTSGPVGAAVTLTGANFSTTAVNNAVKFNGAAATVNAATATQLTVTVPTGATTGKITVIVNGIMFSAINDFTVTSSSGCGSTHVETLVCLANDFIATLNTSQQTSVVSTLDLDHAKRWSDLPCDVSCRNGLLLGSLSTEQQTAALELMKAASGTVVNEGYEEFQIIRAADDYLGTKQSGYSAGNYIIAFLGTPSATGKWMLQFGGHNYAQNITCDNGKVISITPLLAAVEPNGPFTVNNTNYTNPMTTELAAVRDMLAAFSANELATARIATTFAACLMVPGPTSNTFPSNKQGIKVSALNTKAQQKVLTAIAAWVNDVDPTTASTHLTTYQVELANTYVTYSGNANGVSGNAGSFFSAHADYVRIDGPSVWIEFVCQNGVVIQNQMRYQTVMRDHNRDYIGLQ